MLEKDNSLLLNGSRLVPSTSAYKTAVTNSPLPRFLPYLPYRLYKLDIYILVFLGWKAYKISLYCKIIFLSLVSRARLSISSRAGMRPLNPSYVSIDGGANQSVSTFDTIQLLLYFYF